MFQLIVVTLGCLFLITSNVDANTVPRPRLDGRIVGGKQVDITEIPFQISLQRRGHHMCGGTLISKQIVLTAAHCTSGSKAKDLKIRTGSTQCHAGGVIVNVKKIHQHAEYDSETIDADFAILELANYNETSIVHGIAVLPEEGEYIEDGTPLQVSGWGKTQNFLESNKNLRAVTVPKVNQELCSNAYSWYGGVTERMVCAGYPEGAKDACQGDSGGPLILNGTLVGVVSWGFGCAVPNFPGVYSRVSSVRNWIREISGI